MEFGLYTFADTIELLGDVVAPAVRKALGHSPMSTGADERRRVNATA